MIGLLVIGIIVTIAGLYMTQTSDGSQGKDSGRFRGKVASIIGVIVIVISIIIGSFTTIPAGHRGVVIRFSAVTGSILNEGLQMKLPFLDSVVKMSVQTEKYETGAASASRDLQDVNTTIALNWRLDPSMAAEVYRTLGMDFIDRIAAPAVQETIKQVTAKYIAEDLILKREMVKNEIQENLSNRLLQRGIITETVSIKEFQFSATFVAAILSQIIFRSTPGIFRVPIPYTSKAVLV